ncbi:MAG: anhydro-N-acetylmuramic acid kinase [Rhodospirillales bacterium RIFCSPLOWO2_12_FULL_58_28]|nr:MAG: anhydro-N-acetylmuramic acid kinase [Rhodospirillales bacterium RIFCSPLOWO2_02_FULL_58_16]OHC77415.1 MAG: anhydro-N-acetylmuramic acid kinase [Rhodospirillales bacterium RIFCSPLOWO2_12_FULL_58_28]
MKALGLMSGTSLDGIDAAIIDTDGERVLSFGPALTIPYADDFRERLRNVLAGGESAMVERELTLLHAEAVKRLPYKDVELVGFHGHTVEHRPADGVTRQIGDGALLAKEIGIPAVGDFRSNDVAAGGEGAPLAPLFHAALARNLEKPLVVLNIGGVANVTWMGTGGELSAFDAGPGNALIDDRLLKTTGRPMDKDGALARSGKTDEMIVAGLLAHPYFNKPPPKSLDRNDFNADEIARLSPADGAATLTAFTVQAIAAAVKHLPAPPKRWLVCGGGRRNKFMMDSLNEALGGNVEAVEAEGWNGDALEAQAFAYLAVRSLMGLPLSLPATTGVGKPTTGGVLHRP